MNSPSNPQIQRPPLHAVNADMPDAALVAAAIDGSLWAKETLYRRHVDAVSRLAYRLLARDEDIDDIVQETFMHAFEGLSKIRNPDAFRSFLMGITIRRARRRIRKMSLLRRLGILRAQPIEGDTLIAPDAPPDVAAELSALYPLLEELPADARVALVLRRVEGLSMPEIAEQLGTSLSTAKRRLQEAEVLLSGRVSRPRSQS